MDENTNDLQQPLDIVHGDHGFTTYEEAYEYFNKAYDQHLNWFESNFTSTFGAMRHSTEEESQAYRRMLDRLSVPIDVDISFV